MKPITKVTVGQEIPGEVLNAWADLKLSKHITYSVDSVHSSVFYIVDVTSHSTYVALKGFVNFYNSFYGLNVTEELDFRNTKLQVTPEESVLVQKKLFELGYGWNTVKVETVNPEAPYLFINSDRLVGWSNTPSYFSYHSNKLITVNDILGKQIIPRGVGIVEHLTDQAKKITYGEPGFNTYRGTIDPCNEFVMVDWQSSFPNNFKVYSPNYDISLQILAKMKELGGEYWKHATFNNKNEVWWALEGGHIIYTTIKATFLKWNIPEIQYTELNLKTNKKHEHIIVQRKTPTITGGQRIPGTPISGGGCRATVTSRHLSFRAISC